LINGQSGAGNSAVAGTLDSFAVIGAGGDFSRELNATWDATTTVALGYGHSLGAQTVIPPGGDASIADFSCTNCHDPHGAYNAPTATVNEYRNLRISATGASANAGVTLNAGTISYVGDQSAAAAGKTVKFIPLGTGGNAAANRRVWPVYDNDAALTGTPATDAPRSNTYRVTAGFASGTDGISRWCAQCHDNWHEALVGGNRDTNAVDWHRHPVDNALNDGTTTSGAGVTIIDTANYAAQVAGYKALPIADTNGTASNVAYLPSGQEANSKVFCLSCHFAHGGPYYDLLRWDYLSSVGPAGSQQGNSIASTVGCQLCHNR
jgi:predicted CXXCH cytochrome family protein